jgi:hypothetical protein
VVGHAPDGLTWLLNGKPWTGGACSGEDAGC